MHRLYTCPAGILYDIFIRFVAANYVVMKDAGIVYEPLADDINLVSHLELIEFDRYFPNPCLALDSMFDDIVRNPETQYCGELISFQVAKDLLMATCQKRWTEITDALIEITPR